MRTLKEYKLLIMNGDEVVKLLKLKNYYDDRINSFEFDSMKKQLYTNPKLKNRNIVTYGNDGRLISMYLDNTLYDFQGYKDWAELKRYIEKDESGKWHVNTKKLVRRFKDIERGFQRRLNKERGLSGKTGPQH